MTARLFPAALQSVCLAGWLLLGSMAGAAEWLPAAVPTREPLPGAAPVWLRCFVRVPDNMTIPEEKDLWRDSITLSLGGVDGPFSVWLNGEKIAAAGGVAKDARRRFKVPKDILQKKAFNVLAVRLEGTARGGLALPPILAGYFDEQAFDGAWEMFEGEPEPAQLRATDAQPGRAFYTEAGFHKSSSPLAPTEFMPGARLSPAESLAKMTVPEDLAVDLMLSEPLVAQPTHVSFDERGRMWVAQYRQYPFPAGIKMISRDQYYRSRFDRVPPAPPHHDRGRDIISVHEDTDGDGVLDKHRVVLEGLNMANAALRGHGGIWVMQTPYLLFYPDADGDDVPDAEPEVRLAGFGLEDTHSVANGLVWGPDGWLYGAQGSTTTSRVVRPGTDPADFAGLYHEGCMVWRYHPQTRAYEIFAEGGGNVFELEFDAEGRLYSGHNGGDTRGFHYLQSGLFLKQGIDPGKFGPQGNVFAFGYLEAMKSRHPIARFSHATIMAEGTALPARFAGHFLAADPLHRQIIASERFPGGSTFETKDSGIALEGADPAFRPVFLCNAPDGAVYVADFYEEFIAHGQNYQGQIDPGTGRIYRIRGKAEALNKDVNLAGKTGAQLVALLAHPNRWHRQTAVRLLGERRDPATREGLHAALAQKAEHPALEALWALHQMGALDEKTALLALSHPQPAVRAWSIRLAGDEKKLSQQFHAALLQLGADERDAEVLAQVASTARRLPAAQGLPLAGVLLKNELAAADLSIPLLCWWTLESHCAADREAVLAGIDWQAPGFQKHILARLMRRFAGAGGRADLLACAQLLEAAPAGESRGLLMAGFEEAFKGRALPPLPEPLVEALAKSGLASRHLRVRLREGPAVAEALKVAANEGAKMEERLLCVRLFGEVTLPESVPVLLALAVDSKSNELRKASLTALLLYDQAVIGQSVAAAYSQLPAAVQPAAQTLLASRPAWSLAFLKLVAGGQIPAAAVWPSTVAMLRESADAAVGAMAREVFAKQDEAAPQTQAEILRLRQIIAAAPGDPYKGEPIFLARCASCHTLFFKGGRVGPDLTAYQRDDLGTLLPSIVEPGAEIREGYINQLLGTRDGRTLSGFLVDQDRAVVVLRGPDGQDVSVARAEVREMRAAAASLMPPGLLGGLSDQELRDFFAYLRIPQPISK